MATANLETTLTFDEAVWALSTLPGRELNSATLTVADVVAVGSAVRASNSRWASDAQRSAAAAVNVLLGQVSPSDGKVVVVDARASVLSSVAHSEIDANANLVPVAAWISQKAEELATLERLLNTPPSQLSTGVAPRRTPAAAPPAPVLPLAQQPAPSFPLAAATQPASARQSFPNGDELQQHIRETARLLYSKGLFGDSSFRATPFQELVITRNPNASIALQREVITDMRENGSSSRFGFVWPAKSVSNREVEAMVDAVIAEARAMWYSAPERTNSPEAKDVRAERDVAMAHAVSVMTRIDRSLS